LKLRIQVQPLRGSALVEDYLRGAEPAASFFEGRPADLGAFRRKLDETARRFGRAERERAAAALRPTSPRAAERLARFVEEGGAMVTTGQQAGLFTGPLYTIHKVLTAVRLAASLEAELGVVVLPVFWVASEDHDWEEAAEAHVVTAGGEVRRLSVSPTDARPLPMSEMRFGPDVESAVGEFCKIVGEYGDAGDLIERIREAYRPGATVAGAFREVAEALFAPFGVLVTDAADPALKEASLPILSGELERAAENERAVAERTAELAAAGYATQVTVIEDATNLFYHGEAGRERLLRDGDGFVAKESGRRFTADEAAAELRAHPGRFSPNVFLRPVVESAVFPTLAYVGGPGETAYFAQVGPLFRSFGIVPPVVFPRFSAVLVPGEADAVLGGLGMAMEELRPPLHEVVQAVARRTLPAPVRERMLALRRAIVEEYAALMEAAHPIDPQLDGALGALRNRSLLDAAAAERKILGHLKRREARLTREVERARNHLYPGGVPQERVLNLFPYLAAYGPSLLHDLAERMAVRWERAPAGVG
jgi:bacillithiol biosynthesis cysteine-adding enzyme BshC